MMECKKDQHIEENSIPYAITKSSTHHENLSEITFSVPDLFPEGIVYDPFQNWFYVSSVTSGCIGIVKMDGSYQPFISAPSLTSTTGLKIDKVKKRLWVANVDAGNKN